MSSSKIILSPAQLELATDEQIILTKNAIIGQVEAWLGEMAHRYQQLAKPYASNYPEIFTLHPKISKGEKQEGLPWVILDYPRRFSLPQGCFAIRTMFWWGRYLSIRVLLSGSWLSRVADLQKQFANHIQGFTLHPFEVDVHAFNFETAMGESNEVHYVLATTVAIEKFHEATTTCEQFVETLLSTILESEKISYPGDGIIP